MGKYLPRPLSNPIGPRPRGLQQTLQMQYRANNMARAVALLSAMPSRQQATDLTLPSAASKFLTGCTHSAANRKCGAIIMLQLRKHITGDLLAQCKAKSRCPVADRGERGFGT